MVNEKALKVIGYFCWWQVNGVKVTREDLQKLIDAAGIDYKVEDVCLRSAFLKAVREVNIYSKRDGILVRKINKAPNQYVFGLVDERIDKAAERLAYSQEATLRFEPEHGNLTCSVPHRAHDKIKALYDEYKDFLTADDVRVIFLDILKSCKIVGVRSNGGIYFVPELHRDVVEKLENLAGTIAGEVQFLVAPQIDVERTKSAIYKAFVEDLKEQIQKFNAELEGEDAIERKGTLKKRLDEFKELKTKVEFYQDALSMQAGDLSKELTALQEKVTQKLFG